MSPEVLRMHLMAARGKGLAGIVRVAEGSGRSLSRSSMEERRGNRTAGPPVERCASSSQTAATRRSAAVGTARLLRRTTFEI